MHQYQPWPLHYNLSLLSQRIRLIKDMNSKEEWGPLGTVCFYSLPYKPEHQIIYSLESKVVWNLLCPLCILLKGQRVKFLKEQCKIFLFPQIDKPKLCYEEKQLTPNTTQWQTVCLLCSPPISPLACSVLTTHLFSFSHD